VARSGDSTAYTAVAPDVGATSGPEAAGPTSAGPDIGATAGPYGGGSESCPVLPGVTGTRPAVFACPRSVLGDTPPAPGLLETAIRRVLFVPVGPAKASDDAANRLFSASILLSALRCLFTYIVVPVLVPLVGPAVGNSPAIGIPLSLLALVFDVRAVRRFWLANHPWRWRMTAVYAALMVMVGALFIIDVVHAVS
jgi:hypothetical protein